MLNYKFRHYELLFVIVTIYLGKSIALMHSETIIRGSIQGYWTVIIYSALQARSIGLSFNDIGVVSGVIPMISVLANPFLGFLGDKIGLKPVLLITMVGMAVSGTCIDLTPRYKEYYTYSQALVTAQNMTEGKYFLRSIQWPINYPDCISHGDQDIVQCQNAAPVIDPDFYNNITEYMECQHPNGDSIQIDTLDTSAFAKSLSNNLVTLKMPHNETFCDLYMNYEDDVEEQNINCQIKENPFVKYCIHTEGSHTIMFFTYLFLRVCQAVCDNTMYSLMYGTASHLIKEHNGDFSMTLLWNAVAGIIGPLLAGVLVVDSNDSSVETNYQMVYYLSDGFVVVSCLIVIMFVHVKAEKHKQSIFHAFMRISNPATGVYLLIMLILGMGMGIFQTYLMVYLQEDLKASSAMIGISTSIGMLSCILMAPFAKRCIVFIGDVNMILCCMIVTAFLFIMYGLIIWIPPYHMYMLALLTFVVIQYNWTAVAEYTNKIAPPTLVATALALNSCFQFMLGTGIGGFVGGQLVDNLGCSLQLLFKIVALFLFSCAVILYFVYNKLCKKYEDRLIKVKEDEILKSQNIENVKGEICSKVDLDRGGPYNNRFNNLRNPIIAAGYGNSIMYRESQTIGKTRF